MTKNIFCRKLKTIDRASKKEERSGGNSDIFSGLSRLIHLRLPQVIVIYVFMYNPPISGFSGNIDKACGVFENAEHFLLQCPIYMYQQQRITPTQIISQHCQFSSDLLLYGDISLPLEINILVLETVQKYI